MTNIKKNNATNTILKNQNLTFNLTPGYISGLTQTDGSFFCSIILSAKHRFGIQFRPKFTITADLESRHVLESIKTYFGCGIINNSIKNHTAEFVVERIKDIVNIIISHFKKYTVFCAKLHAFELFTQISFSLFNKEKRSLEGRRELLIMALSMNKTTLRKEARLEKFFSLLEITSKKDKELFPNTKTAISDSTIIFNDFIAGVIDGDGSFFTSFSSKGKISTGFSITSDIFSKPFLEKIQLCFKGIGTIYIGSKKELRYAVNNLNEINEILIPFMNNNPLFSKRALYFDKFKEISQLLIDEKPLTLKTKLKIVELVYNSNKGGKHRRIKKSNYIDLLKQIHSNN